MHQACQLNPKSWRNRHVVLCAIAAFALFGITFHVLTATASIELTEWSSSSKSTSPGESNAGSSKGLKINQPAPYTYDGIDGHPVHEEEAQDPCQDIDLPDGGKKVLDVAAGTKVLVTGGAGFIGSNLVDRLLELGYTVRVLDNLYTGFLRNVPLHKKGVEFILGDILDPDVLAQAAEGVDYVYHLAAMSKVVPSVKDPDMARFCVETNALGTWNVLNAIRNVNNKDDGTEIKKVIYAASSTYYGNKPAPHQEDMAPDFLTPYAASKYEGELQMEMFDSLFQVPTISTRFFMVYGPRQPSTGAYAIVTGVFAKQAAEGRPLTIEGDGSHYRDFIHVQDIVNGLILSQQHPTLRGNVVNLGSGTSFSVQDVADLVSSHQEHVDARANDLEGTLADTCRMKKLLGYRTTRDFKEEMGYMVKKTLEGEVFMQSWLTPSHALAAPHLLALGTPVFSWPSDRTDLDALLKALENIELNNVRKDSHLISVISFSLGDGSEDIHAENEALLNTVFSLVRFGGVFNYFVAADSEAALTACVSLNLPCYDAQKTNPLGLIHRLLAHGYDVHFAEAGNSYTRPVAPFAREQMERSDSGADVYQSSPFGDFFVRSSEHAQSEMAALAKSSAHANGRIRDLFTADKWTEALARNLKVASFEASMVCEHVLDGSDSSSSRPRSSPSSSSSSSSPSVGGSSSSFCDSRRFYVGVRCDDAPASAPNIKAELQNVNLWHLRGCADKQHCDIQQIVPTRWVQTRPDLTATEALC